MKTFLVRALVSVPNTDACVFVNLYERERSSKYAAYFIGVMPMFVSKKTNSKVDTKARTDMWNFKEPKIQRVGPEPTLPEKDTQKSPNLIFQREFYHLEVNK